VAKRGRTSKRFGAAAATGAVITAVVGGVGGTAAFAAAGHPAKTSSSKIYACYSKTTDALSYLNYPTVKNCTTGETRISWNAAGRQGAKGATGAQGAQGAAGTKGSRGPQGAAGAAGAQGAAGAKGAQGAAGSQGVAGPQGAPGPEGPPGSTLAMVAEHFSGSGAIGIGGAATVVAAVGVSSSGEYVVAGTATGIKNASDGYLICRVVDVSSNGAVFAATPWGYNNTAFTYGTMAENGGMFASFRNIIEEQCETNVASAGVSVITATLTATLADDIDGTTRAKPGSRKPINSYLGPAARPRRGKSDRPGA
jgi:Collagen triple helix repeat (20 copies)